MNYSSAFPLKGKGRPAVEIAKAQRDADADHACLVAEALAGSSADSRDALIGACPREPRRAGNRAQRRRVRSARAVVSRCAAQLGPRGSDNVRPSVRRPVAAP